MAEQLDLEQSGLQEVANAMREENVMESHIINSANKRKREESADDTRRFNKRVSPNSNTGADQSSHAQDAAVEALQDYSALHHHSGDNQNGSAEHASSTAAAALAGIFPTLTVPQPTDVSFGAPQGSDSDRNPESSFMDNSQQGQENYVENTQPAPRAKLAVGSEEWHKVRKDNHKEGK